MKIAIFAPRLDCSFKKGHVPDNMIGKYGVPNHPLREYWIKFVDMLELTHKNMGHDVDIIVKPLWAMGQNDIKKNEYDLIYIPHKHKFQFDCGPQSRYYMQMVIPHIFSIDWKGWCGGDSKYPIKSNSEEQHCPNFDRLSQRILKNESKFPQPIHNSLEHMRDYILFVCQLPHDQTIKIHSHLSVVQGLRRTLKFGAELGMPVVVKGHPANPNSMAELKQITEADQNAIWIQDCNIHSLLSNCAFMATINSGVGIEAILHGKKILAFGTSEYDGFRYAAKTEDEMRKVLTMEDNILFNRNFIEKWCSVHYDVTDVNSFRKLENENQN